MYGRLIRDHERNVNCATAEIVIYVRKETNYELTVRVKILAGDWHF
jgi:hypothetical protein